MDDIEREIRNARRRERYAADAGHRRKRNAQAKKWKTSNRAEYLEQQREYARGRRAIDPDGEREYQRAWGEKNPEKIRSRNRKWYKKHGRKYHREWAARNRVKNPEIYVWRNARNRARYLGREFSIQKTDIVIPDICPVLGTRIEKCNGPFLPNSPSLDRIDSTKGYVAGNIAVISNRANLLKRDGTLDEFRKIVAYMESHQQA